MGRQLPIFLYIYKVNGDDHPMVYLKFRRRGLMQIWAISDLHLPSSLDRSMSKFGRNWENHPRQIEENWKVGVEDVVLMPGDLSWGKTLDDARPDFEFLASLPGRKLFVKGNHDYCFSNEKKAKAFLESLDTEVSSMRLIHNDSVVLDMGRLKVGVAGSRGWSSRGNETELKILDRELNRMERSINSLPSVDRLIILIHFPPTDRIKEGFRGKLPGCNPGDEDYLETYDDRMLELILNHNPDIVVCGHVHTYRIENPVIVEELPLYCVSADIVGFEPVKIPLV